MLVGEGGEDGSWGLRREVAFYVDCVEGEMLEELFLMGGWGGAKGGKGSNMRIQVNGESALRFNGVNRGCDCTT